MSVFYKQSQGLRQLILTMSWDLCPEVAWKEGKRKMKNSILDEVVIDLPSRLPNK